MSHNWTTIESDPGVFTELLEDIGVDGVEVTELFDLEQSTFNQLKPILGLIFLFKYEADSEPRAVVDEEDAEGIYFARQMINNACATQALCNVLFNRPDVELKTQIRDFRDFSIHLDSESRGYAIGESELLRTVHNSYARPEPFIFEEKKEKDDEAEDAFHFIGYVPINGLLYELDGLQRGPIIIGAVDEGDADSWLSLARDAMQDRIAKYAAKEIRFNLMAIVKQHQKVYEEQLADVNATIQRIQAALSGQQVQQSATQPISTTTSSIELPSDQSALQQMLNEYESKATDLQAHISDEKQKHARYKQENIRRKHNYVPFIFNLLRELAQRDKLHALVESASRKSKERFERNQTRKEAEKQKQAPDAPKKDTSTVSKT